MFYLKHSGQEKWMACGARALVPDIGSFESYAQMVQHLPQAESFMELKAAFERISELGGIVVDNHSGNTLLEFINKCTTKMQNVMMFECDPVDVIRAQIKFVEVLEKNASALKQLSAALKKQKGMTAAEKELIISFDLSDEVSYKSGIYYMDPMKLGTYMPTMIAAKAGLEKVIKNITKFEVVERNAQNSYIQKKAWAIFADNGHSVGFASKNGYYADISAARLFDSDKGALRTASSMRIDNFEVIEVEVTMKRRTNLRPEFQSEKLEEALATIERDKIDNFLYEVGEDRVKAALKKRVSKI